MQKYQDIVLNSYGRPVQGASISVTDAGGVPVAIYGANTIGANINPVTSDVNGRFWFYAPDGRYSLVVSVDGTIYTTLTDVLVEDPADGGGTVTSVAVASTNGFAGTVATATSTPVITVSTSITGILKGNATAISAAVAGTDYVAPGGALGTPLSGVATNLTGLPMTTGVTGILAGTNGGTGVNNSTRTLTLAGNVTFTGAFNVSLTMPGAYTYTFPGATDTLIGRVSTDTLTNKRVSARTGTTASSATPTINTDNVDLYSITALAAAITSFTTNLTGTPVAGDCLVIEITDNGTARALAWGASFEASTVALPTTTVISTKMTVGFMWNTATSKWRIQGVA